jgi:hypothetical protein
LDPAAVDLLLASAWAKAGSLAEEQGSRKAEPTFRASEVVDAEAARARAADAAVVEDLAADRPEASADVVVPVDVLVVETLRAHRPDENVDVEAHRGAKRSSAIAPVAGNKVCVAR